MKPENNSYGDLLDRLLKGDSKKDSNNFPSNHNHSNINLININKFTKPKILLQNNTNFINLEKISNTLRGNYSFKKIDTKNLIPYSNILNPQTPIQIQYNPNFTNLNFNALPQPGIVVDTKTRITADNVAEFAYPLAQFVEQVRPDFIIACDRGARIIGLAVHMLYSRLYGALPTQDHAISFRKISHKVPEDAVRDILRPDVERMLSTTTDSPTVLVLDDWVATGGTKSLVHELLAELSGGRVNVLYGVMRGGGGDVTGSQDSAALGDWHDRADLIGVDYNSSDLRPFRVDSRAALDYRRRMSASIDSFVKDLTLQPVK